MLKVILEGHGNYYGIEDILRMFFGSCQRDEENTCVICAQGPDLTIVSAAREDELPVNRQVKRDLYAKLVSITGQSFPWGSLTGIRPTLIAREEDYSPSAVMRKYLVREDKAILACKIALREFETAREARGASHIYAGVPFCPGRCEYCSFISRDATRHLKKLGEYKDAMLLEALEISKYLKDPPMTFYMGGGTPTVFNDDDFEKLLTGLTNIFRLKEAKEFTVEAGRPDTITENKLAVMRKCGVTRICINPQTMRDETLRRLNRGHSSDDIIKAFSMARKAGISNINMDLIAGLKYETADDFIDSVKKVIDLEPENITIHTLYKKRRADMSREDVLAGCGRGDIDEAITKAYGYLTDKGYEPYYMYRQKDTESGLENTGFCKPGTLNVYNVAMMSTDCSVMSVGAGASSKRAYDDGRVERLSNPKDVSLYIRNAKECALKKISFFDLSRSDR